MWMMLRAQPRPCFNLELVHDILGLAQAARDSRLPIDFWVTGSLIPASTTSAAISTSSRRRSAPASVSRCCRMREPVSIACMRPRAVSIPAPSQSPWWKGPRSEAVSKRRSRIISCSAERCPHGFSGDRLQSVPGHGRLFASGTQGRHASRGRADRHRRVHTAEWYAGKGLVDQLFEPGEAYVATRTFIDTLRPKMNGIRAMLRARQRVLKISRAELMEITEDWVEAASRSKKRIWLLWSGSSCCRTAWIFQSCV